MCLCQQRVSSYVFVIVILKVIIVVMTIIIFMTIIINKTIIILMMTRQAQGSGRSSSPLSLFSWQRLLCSSLSGTSDPYPCICNRPTIFFNKTVFSQEKRNIEMHYWGPGLNYSLTISPKTTCTYMLMPTCCRNRIV